ncbi:adrenodoxin [Galendromus occidentalis]|uniref:Adrenodoxin n=1 Tax=Galendromus occidentalis TaxID=34638 RepID=A0AAJ6VYH1_9ACAR|nr:adrenodoxin [Galendromus occidentalis]
MLAARKFLQIAALQTRNFHRMTFPLLNKKEFEVTFVRESGEKIKTKGKVGDSLFDVIVNNDIDIDGFGACEGTLACSTCHLIFKPEDYEKLNEKPTDEELDMLDLAYGLTDTSRLGCQVFLTEKESGMEVKVPAGVNDQRAA